MERAERTFTWLLPVGVPPIVLLASAVVLLIAGAAGFHPAWTEEELNLSEAAALRDAGLLARRLDAGEDPNDAAAVRAAILGSAEVRVTPIEAAVAAHRLEIVRLLIQRGASLDEETRERLVERARRQGDNDIVEYLKSRSPSAGARKVSP